MSDHATGAPYHVIEIVSFRVQASSPEAAQAAVDEIGHLLHIDKPAPDDRVLVRLPSGGQAMVRCEGVSRGHLERLLKENEWRRNRLEAVDRPASTRRGV